MKEPTHIPGARVYIAIIIGSFAIASLVNMTPLPALCRRCEKLIKRAATLRQHNLKKKKRR